MPTMPRRIAVFSAALLLTSTMTLPARAISIDVGVDVGNPMDLLDNVKKKPKPKAPVKQVPVVKTTAILPPKSEKRFIADEVLVETKPDITEAAVAAIASRHGLQLIATADIGLLNAKVHRFRITNGRSVRVVLTGLGTDPGVLLAQPNYIYALLDPGTAPAEAPGAAAPQYAVDLLHLTEAHRLALGRAVKIGILDTAITDSSAELGGSISNRYDPVGATTADDPSHGTALAGIVAAHGELTGVAPDAELLSARAFVAVDGKPPSSNSFLLLQSIDWLDGGGARIINMSFAGPSDPLFLKAVKAAHDRGILVVAAAGNDGPKAPPDFPAADPSTLAVTAIDDGDAVLPQANHGDYIDLAAPGVDVLVLTPDGGYTTSSGTSVAAAHVSGAAALLLERNPSLTPDELETLLTSTALDLGPKGRDRTFGAGLVEPAKALEAAVAKPAPAPAK